MGIENYIEEYLESKIVNGIKPNSIKKYRNELMRFNKFLIDSNIEIENIELKDMTKFYMSINNLAVSNKNCIKMTVAEFIKYLTKAKIIDKDKEDVISQTKIQKPKYNKQEKYMNKKEIEAFLDFLHNAPKQRNEKIKTFDFLRARDRFLFELLINRGTRATETTLIELSDIKEDTIVLDGKTRKNGEELEVYLDAQFQDLLKKYLVERNKLNIQHNYLFVRSNGSVLFLYDEEKDIYDGAAPITEELQRRIKQVNMWCLLKGVNVNIDEKLTAHCLRHTCSYLLQVNGFTLQEIASILGQSSLSSTVKYEHINNEDIKEKFNNL